MKIAEAIIRDSKTGQSHRKTLIQTELGSYFLVSEELSTGDTVSRRIDEAEARTFRESTGKSAIPR